MVPTAARIVIVGAGPTGLAAAISLVVNGVSPEDLVIVDNVAVGENTSRATAIHAATLEALDTIGCADRMIQTGLKQKKIFIRDRSALFLTEDFSYIESYTKYSFTLSLSQAVTEQILLERLNELGVQVVRPYRVVGLKPSDEGLDVSFESGDVIKAAYVIGADGARSVVRQVSGIGFADPDGLPVQTSVHDAVTQLALADVTFSSPVKEELRGVTLSPAGLCFIMPIGLDAASTMMYGTTEPIYRIGVNFPLVKGPPPSNPSLEFLQECLNEQGPFELSSDPTANPNPIQISKVYWSGRFRTHSAIADSFFKRIPGEGESLRAGGIVMLIGDAAHIHSPAGGQGMNLGLRDAISLGPLISQHLRSNDYSESGIAALRDFAASRRKKALDVIRLTKRALTLATTVITSSRFSWLVTWLFSLVSRIPVVKRNMAWQLSGLGNR